MDIEHWTLDFSFGRMLRASSQSKESKARWRCSTRRAKRGSALGGLGSLANHQTQSRTHSRGDLLLRPRPCRSGQDSSSGRDALHDDRACPEEWEMEAPGSDRRPQALVRASRRGRLRTPPRVSPHKHMPGASLNATGKMPGWQAGSLPHYVSVVAASSVPTKAVRKNAFDPIARAT